MRVFFALSLDEKIKNTIDKFNKENILPVFNNIKKVDRENLHITLRFIGDIDENIVDLMRNKIMQQTFKSNSFDTQIQGLGVFPSAQKARIMWIGLKNNIDKIINLYNQINNLLNELRITYEEEKSFHPHITIGRFKKPPFFNKVNEMLVKHKDTTFGTTNVNSITLYKSTLTSEKPIYTPLFNFRFNNHQPKANDQ